MVQLICNSFKILSIGKWFPLLIFFCWKTQIWKRKSTKFWPISSTSRQILEYWNSYKLQIKCTRSDIQKILKIALSCLKYIPPSSIMYKVLLCSLFTCSKGSLPHYFPLSFAVLTVLKLFFQALCRSNCQDTTASWNFRQVLFNASLN